MDGDHVVASQREKLRDFLDKSETTVLFFIENTPASPRGTRCKLPTCNKIIHEGSHRLALNPGVCHVRSSDFYHVACFEEIADFSQANFLDRIIPLSRRNFQMRGLRGTQILDGDYFCQGAVERLVLEWKVQRGRQIDERDGISPLPPTDQESAFMNLLRNAGSSTASIEMIPRLSMHEYFRLSYSLAPFESDGPDDANEWNLFREYLNAGEEKDSLGDRNSLSNMLNRWERDSDVVMTDDRYLDEVGRQRKAQLGDKALRAIERLSTVPMPDFQSAWMGRRW